MYAEYGMKKYARTDNKQCHKYLFAYSTVFETPKKENKQFSFVLCICSIYTILCIDITHTCCCWTCTKLVLVRIYTDFNEFMKLLSNN